MKTTRDAEVSGGYTLIPLRAKYRFAIHGRFKSHYDHQPGVWFKDEQGVKHQVPDKRKNQRGTADTRISDLRRAA